MQEVKKETSSPTFSARIVITDAEKKIILIGNGDKGTMELFFTVLKRLEERMQKSEIFTGTFYEVEEKKKEN